MIYAITDLIELEIKSHDQKRGEAEANFSTCLSMIFFQTLSNLLQFSSFCIHKNELVYYRPNFIGIGFF
jgi:hypothetical protein